MEEFKLQLVADDKIKVISPDGLKPYEIKETKSGDLEILYYDKNGREKSVVKRHPLKEKAINVRKRKNLKNGLRNATGLVLAASLFFGAQTMEFKQEIEPLLEEEAKVEEMVYDQEVYSDAEAVVSAIKNYKDMLDHWEVETISEKEIASFVYAVNVGNISKEVYEVLAAKGVVSPNIEEVMQDYNKVVSHILSMNIYLNRSLEHPPNARIGMHQVVLDKFDKEHVKLFDTKSSDFKVYNSDQSRAMISKEFNDMLFSDKFNEFGPGVQLLMAEYPQANAEVSTKHILNEPRYDDIDNLRAELREQIILQMEKDRGLNAKSL